MGKTMETISTLNSAVRTLLAVAVCGAAAYGGWYAYNTYNAKDIAANKAQKELQDKQQELERTQVSLKARELEVHQQAAKIAEQVEELKKKDEQIARLETARRLLKVDHRLARINIVDQTTDEKGEVTSTVEFIELNPEGMPMGEPKKFTMKGDMIYIDGLSVTFDDKYVEQADLERGTSLFSFTRIFTDIQNPKDGQPLDDVGSRPLAYGRGGQISEFESNIWKNFWSLANDKEAASKLGIASIHGSAVSIKPVKGNSYTIELRASAGPKLKQEGKIPGEVK